MPEALVEDGQKNEKKKKRRKKRKIEEVVDSNEMSSEDKVKEEINDILGLVQKEEISEWIDSASIRLGNCLNYWIYALWRSKWTIILTDKRY